MITVTGQNLNIARSIDMVYILQCTRGSNSPWLITQVYLLYYFCQFFVGNYGKTLVPGPDTCCKHFSLKKRNV